MKKFNPMDPLCFCPVCRDRSKNIVKDRLYIAGCIITVGAILAGTVLAFVFFSP